MKNPNILADVNFLLIDDNAFIRSLIRRILEPFGATRIQEAPDGTEGLKILEKWPVDIILTDWVMAPLDGVEFTKIVRNSPRLGHQFAPIILVSAYSEAWRIAHARDAGVTEYILKPISAQKVLSRIAKVIKEPRPFIRTEDYFGPDRRRRDVPCDIERRTAAPSAIGPEQSVQTLKTGTSLFTPPCAHRTPQSLRP